MPPRIQPSAIAALSLLAAALLASAPARAQRTFSGLGDLAGGSFLSQAYGVNADGSVVVGASAVTSGLQAFRWENGTITGLGTLSGTNGQSVAYGVSANGNVVVGASTSANTSGPNREAFRWQNNTMTGLGDLAGGDFNSIAYAVSADGTMSYGSGTSSTETTEATLWTGGAGTAQGLGYVAGGGSLGAIYGVSTDGSAAIGVSDSADYGREAFLRVGADNIGLGALNGSVAGSVGTGLNADATVAVGYSDSDSGVQAFILDNNGFNGIGSLSTHFPDSRANGVSGDGTMVVGHTNVDDGAGGFRQEAFLYTASLGMVTVKQYLLSDPNNHLPTDFSFWQLTDATAISTDGSTIVGFGFDGQGHTQAWRAGGAFAAAGAPECPTGTLLLVGVKQPWDRAGALANTSPPVPDPTISSFFAHTPSCRSVRRDLPASARHAVYLSMWRLPKASKEVPSAARCRG